MISRGECNLRFKRLRINGAAEFEHSAICTMSIFSRCPLEDVRVGAHASFIAASEHLPNCSDTLGPQHVSAPARYLMRILS